MEKILFSDGITRDPEELVYVALPPEDTNQVFNEEVWNYIRKGDDKPTLLRIEAKNVNINESIYNLEGEEIAKRVE